MDTFKKTIKLLEDNFSFKIQKELLEKIKPLFSEVTLKKNDMLICIGTNVRSIYFVVSGLLWDYYIDKDGNDVTRFFAQEGSICGAEAMIVNEPSSICTQALEDCEMISCSCYDFKNLISKNNIFWELWYKSLLLSLEYKIKKREQFPFKNCN